MQDSPFGTDANEMLKNEAYTQSIEKVLLASHASEVELRALKASFRNQKEDKVRAEKALRKRLQKVDSRQKSVMAAHGPQLYPRPLDEKNLFDARKTASEAPSATLEELERLAREIDNDRGALDEAYHREKEERKSGHYVQGAREGLRHDAELFLVILLGSFGFAKTLIWGYENETFPTSMPMVLLYLTIFSAIIYSLGKLRTSVLLKIINGRVYGTADPGGRKHQLASAALVPFFGLVSLFLSLGWPVDPEAYQDPALGFTQMGLVLSGVLLLAASFSILLNLKEFLGICWMARPARKSEKE